MLDSVLTSSGRPSLPTSRYIRPPPPCHLPRISDSPWLSRTTALHVGPRGAARAAAQSGSHLHPLGKKLLEALSCVGHCLCRGSNPEGLTPGPACLATRPGCVRAPHCPELQIVPHGAGGVWGGRVLRAGTEHLCPRGGLREAAAESGDTAGLGPRRSAGQRRSGQKEWPGQPAGGRQQGRRRNKNRNDRDVSPFGDLEGVGRKVAVGNERGQSGGREQLAEGPGKAGESKGEERKEELGSGLPPLAPALSPGDPDSPHPLCPLPSQGTHSACCVV